MADKNLENGMEKSTEKSYKDKWADGLRAKYPDKTFENEDDLYKASMEGYDEVKGRLTRMEDADKKIAEMMEANPDFINMVAIFMGDGTDEEKLAKVMAQFPNSEDMLTEEGRMAYKKEKAAQKERRAKAKAEAAEIEGNIKVAETELTKFAEENGLNDDEVSGFIQFMTSTIGDKLNKGKMDMEFYEMMYRLMNYDKDIEAAREAGRREGMNAGMSSKARRKTTGDGLPDIQNAGAPAPEQPQENNLLGSLTRLNGRNKIHRM